MDRSGLVHGETLDDFEVEEFRGPGEAGLVEMGFIGLIFSRTVFTSDSLSVAWPLYLLAGDAGDGAGAAVLLGEGISGVYTPSLIGKKPCRSGLEDGEEFPLVSFLRG